MEWLEVKNKLEFGLYMKGYKFRVVDLEEWASERNCPEPEHRVAESTICRECNLIYIRNISIKAVNNEDLIHTLNVIERWLEPTICKLEPPESNARRIE